MRKTLAFFILAASFLPIGAFAALPATGSLVKASGPAVYYYANDAKRYVFPNEGTYKSWFTSFDAVKTITDADLALMPIGGNVTYRPGIRMLKVQTDPKVYAVERGGTLRWVTTSQLAESLYGQFWNTFIDDVSDAFFVNYTIGEPIDAVGEYTPSKAAGDVTTIDADKFIPPPANPPLSDSGISNQLEAWRAFALNDLNAIRQQHGKPPLVINKLLNDIAQIHSRDMGINIKDLQHEGFLGESPDERIRDGKVPDVENRVFITVPHPAPIEWSAENIGMITKVKTDEVEEAIQKMHQLFLDEPVDEHNHRTTMLSTFQPYSEVGIGIYLDAAGAFWLTEDFITVP